MKRYVFLIFLLLIFWPLLAEKRGMEPEDILNIKVISDLNISPEGTKILFTVRECNLEENEYTTDVWIFDLKNGELIKITQSPKNDSSPKWSPDGKYIAFISNRDGRNQIYLKRRDIGEPWKLTDSKTGVEAFEWTPDSKSIVYSMREPRSEEEEKKIKEKDDAYSLFKNLKNSHLWKISIDKKDSKKLTDGNFHVSQFKISPDGKAILYSASPSPKIDDSIQNELYLIGIDGGDAKRLTNNRTSERAFRFSPDGSFISFVSSCDLNLKYPGSSKIFLFSLNDLKIKPLTASFKGEVSSYEWISEDKIIFTGAMGVKSNFFILDLKTNSISEFSTEIGVIGEFDFHKDNGIVVFLFSNPSSPPSIYSTPLESFKPVKLVDLNPQVKDFALGDFKPYIWKSKDGKKVEGILGLPQNFEKGKKYPLIVQLHGGPASAYMLSFPYGISSYSHVFTGKGWVVFQPNYRGSSNYGEDFMKEIAGKYFDRSIDDIVSGIESVIKDWIADRDKIAVMGWSAGGHMTNWLITHYPNMFKAACSGAGTANWISMYAQTDIQYTREFYFLDKPWNKVEVYLKYSPILYVKNVKTPTLILCGEEDERVPLPQSKELHMGLLKNGVETELVIFPREPHGLREPKHQLYKMKKELEWLEKWVLNKN
ncbi:MAG: prolyl oligopeptidase family serine peptidase [Candidatus Aminicenantia bacterium]